MFLPKNRILRGNIYPFFIFDKKILFWVRILDNHIYDDIDHIPHFFQCFSQVDTKGSLWTITFSFGIYLLSSMNISIGIQYIHIFWWLEPKTETDRDRQRQTETDRDRQRQTETDRHKQTIHEHCLKCKYLIKRAKSWERPFTYKQGCTIKILPLEYSIKS